jgi:hypothetical protein
MGSSTSAPAANGALSQLVDLVGLQQQQHG